LNLLKRPIDAAEPRLARALAVLHAIPSLDPVQGGPSRTVVALADAQAPEVCFRVGLVSQGQRGAATVSSKETAVERFVSLSDARLALALGLPCGRALGLARLALAPDLIHSHGIWHPANHWAARAARRWGVPLIVQPRGMLEPWALGRKALKKRLALALFQRRDLESARVLVATAEMEYRNLRALGLRQPVAVIPNGVVLPGQSDAASAGDEGLAARGQGAEGLSGDGQIKGGPSLDAAPPASQAAGGQRVALFLSRVHPKKGVVELVRAWARVAPAGWRLRLAGPDEGGHWSEVAGLIDRLGLGSTVEYCGPVEGERKAALYREADLFVLPTFSENFGLVVAEALAYGVPVITTRGAPWADLETYGCGWWIEMGVPPLVEALRTATALSDAERAAMGARGRVYVQRYDWDAIAAETLALYRWVLGQGERPACVRVD